jgi:hypothetical protein
MPGMRSIVVAEPGRSAAFQPGAAEFLGPAHSWGAHQRRPHPPRPHRQAGLAVAAWMQVEAATTAVRDPELNRFAGHIAQRGASRSPGWRWPAGRSPCATTPCATAACLIEPPRPHDTLGDPARVDDWCTRPSLVRGHYHLPAIRSRAWLDDPSAFIGDTHCRGEGVQVGVYWASRLDVGLTTPIMGTLCAPPHPLGTNHPGECQRSASASTGSLTSRSTGNSSRRASSKVGSVSVTALLRRASRPW